MYWFALVCTNTFHFVTLTQQHVRVCTRLVFLFFDETTDFFHKTAEIFDNWIFDVFFR
jgi:hypothetical protein